MTNPVEIIGLAQHRRAQVAALRAALKVLPSALLAIAIGALLPAIAEHSWARWGYALSQTLTADLRQILLVSGVVGLALGALRGWRAMRQSEDLVAAAEEVDLRVGGHEEILTLASFSNSEPGPLFPVLRHRALGYLAKFNPNVEFQFEVAAPLIRGVIAALVLALLMALTTPLLLGLGHSPAAAEARKLRMLAHEISAANSEGDAQGLANELRSAADALDDPRIPPQKKLAQLAAVTARIEQSKSEGDKAREQKQESGGGKGNSGKNTSAKGDSGKGQGQGQGEGEGEGKGAEGQGKGSGSGGKDKGGNLQLADLRNALDKAKAQIESETAKGDQTQTRPDQNKNTGQAPKAGNEQGGKNASDQSKGAPELAMAKPGSGENHERPSDSNQASNKPRKDSGSKLGDTHLGEFPEPGRYERFYKAGEHGLPLDIKNARYVVVRVPPAMSSSGEGKVVIDKDRPTATAPYANAPLREERIKAEPDERQLVPPRYRDLLQ